MAKKEKEVRIYKTDEIQTVYKRHHEHPGSVVYSNIGGGQWKTPSMDTTTWDIYTWVFAFIELN